MSDNTVMIHFVFMIHLNDPTYGTYPSYCLTILQAQSLFRKVIGHVRYINILTWLRGFRVKNVNFLSFFCPSIPKRHLDTNETTRNIEVCPESLGAMLGY